MYSIICNFLYYITKEHIFLLYNILDQPKEPINFIYGKEESVICKIRCQPPNVLIPEKKEVCKYNFTLKDLS